MWKSPFSASKLLQNCSLPAGHAPDLLNITQFTFLTNIVSFNCLCNTLSILAPLVQAGTFRSKMMALNVFITAMVEDSKVYSPNTKYHSFMNFQRNKQKSIYLRVTLLCSCKNLTRNVVKLVFLVKVAGQTYFSGLKYLKKKKEKR